MSIVDVLEAKTHLSRLVEEVESGATPLAFCARLRSVGNATRSRRNTAA
jgi:hypothetical protein